jgi:hypothetical protein
VTEYERAEQFERTARSEADWVSVAKLWLYLDEIDRAIICLAKAQEARKHD